MSKNKFLRILICTFAHLHICTSLLASPRDTTVDYYSDKTLRYEDHIYVPNIKTVQLSIDPSIMEPPIIKLNSDQTLQLSFDDLDSDLKTYSYTVIHCTANWEASNILVSEYLDGFADNPIQDYRFSRATLQKYTHYSVSFPNDGLKFRISGNYLLEVYSDNDAEKICFTKRFMVFEDKVSVDASVHPATMVEDRNFKQEVDFNINYNASQITNAYSEISPVILQNNRWDNAITGLKPQFLKDQQLVYDYDGENVFKGGSEFRWFDTRSLRYQTERIQSIEKDSVPLYNVWLLPDDRRTYKRYLFTNDINGKFLIKTNDGGTADVDADYSWVHFFLPWDPPTSEGNMYVFGAFCDWQCRPDCRMKYNYVMKGYEASIYLKQGYYNYEYVIQRDNEKTPDDFFAEGMHQETENDYTILVYYRKTGAWTDELVCVRRINSKVQ
jgi:hypothetical protein